MTKITAYLSKDQTGAIELWKSKPVYNRESGLFDILVKNEVGTEITDDNFLDSLLKEGECIEIEITKTKTVYDYSKSPEGKLMNAIFGNKK